MIAGGLRRLARRPVLVVLLLGVVFVGLQMWWVARVRHLGAFNVDEEGGIAAALRFHRNLDLHTLRPIGRAIFHTWNGPVVPLLSVPALIPGSRTATWVILIQPILVVAAACSAAGIVKAVTANSGAAVVAGIALMCCPVSVISSRSYQYSTGVGAFLGLALWALVTSDRGRKRWHMIGAGVATALMVMSRTMAVGFVPGLAVAGLVIVAKERKVLVNAVLSVLALLAVAGPWWTYNLGRISHYIYVNAFGDRAHFWGSVPFMQRLRDHVSYLGADFRMLVIPAVLGIQAAWMLVVSPRMRAVVTQQWDSARRDVLALWLAVALGFVSLFSTSNVGFWFAYPMDVVLVAAVASLVAAAPAPKGWPFRGWRPALGGLATAVAVMSFGLALNPNGAVGSQGYSPRFVRAFVTTHNQLQGGNIEADPRMGSTDVSVRRQAADDWWHASLTLAKEVDTLQRGHGEIVQSIIGEIHLLNANTVGLVEEQTNIGIAGIEVVNTLEPPDSVLRETLTPRRGRTIRVIVMIEGKSLGFPDGRGWRRYRRLAVEEGWKPRRRIPLPDGGQVVLYTHPDSIPGP